jgi:hypothetical protein
VTRSLNPAGANQRIPGRHVTARHDRASGSLDVPARRSCCALSFVLLAAIAIACGPVPTPTPSQPPPTQSPVQASPNPALVEFETHLADATARQGQLVRALAAASVGSNDRLGLAARQLADWATAEQTWLEAHPADACYEDAWLTFASGVDDIATAAAGFVELAAAPSPPSDEAGQAAAEPLSAGGESITAAADLAQQARARCR